MKPANADNNVERDVEATVGDTLMNIDRNALAIVGIACRVPGADSFAALGDLLDEGRETITWLPPSDDQAPREYRNDPRYVPAAALLNDVRHFDPAHFGISHEEACRLDPQQRLLLELSVEALDDTKAVRRDELVTGTYMGTDPSAYLLHHLIPMLEGPLDPQWFPTVIANDKDFAAAQVAFRLGLKGPVVGVQGACATGLVALHVAAQALLAGECDRALVGAAAVRLPERCGYLAIPGALFSTDGHTRSYDAAGSGTVYGSGAVVLVLRRASDAIEAGEPIHAFIRGSAVHNQGAARPGFAAPSVDGHVNVLEEALAVAELEPHDVHYLEGNGTATPMGDALEILAWKRVFHDHPLYVGSIRSNLGHLQSAAGLAGLLKTVHALHTGRIAPTLHHTRPNSAFRDSRLVVNSTSVPFPEKPSQPRRAIVTAFGVGGFHGAVVLEQASRSRTADSPRRSSRVWNRVSCWLERPGVVETHHSTTKDPVTLEALQSRLMAALPANAPTPSVDTPLVELGLSSLDLVQFLAQMERSWPNASTHLTALVHKDLTLRTLHDTQLRIPGQTPNQPRESAMKFVELTQRLVTIPGGTIEVFEGGAGPTLVLLPPLGCQAHVWRPLVNALDLSVHIIAPNPPGLGAGDAGSWDHGWVREVLRALNITQPVHLVGWSYGGTLAASAALDTPARFATLTLLCSTGCVMPSPSVARLREMLERVKLAVARETANDVAMRAAFSEAPLPVLIEQARFLLTYDISSSMGELRLPVLIVSGGSDEVLPAEHQTRMLERLPGASHFCLEAAGHLLPATHANELAPRLLEFIQSTSVEGMTGLTVR